MTRSTVNNVRLSRVGNGLVPRLSDWVEVRNDSHGFIGGVVILRGTAEVCFHVTRRIKACAED